LNKIPDSIWFIVEKRIMRIDILSIFPQMFEGFLTESIVKRATEKGIVEVHLHNIRDFATNKHKRVDDYAYGHGAGMVMMADPIAQWMDKLMSERQYDEIIFTTPDGKVLNQNMANHLSTFENIIILCGHYKGVDERIREKYITLEMSIGDYVLSGGELAAAVLTDAIVRLIPGVLSNESSALTDSFQNGLLSSPVYTRPSEWRGMKVPDILLSGNERLIDEWNMEQALKRTRKRRPDLL
jgi:tRNA (guanine37-N1)-methyltransferase